MTFKQWLRTREARNFEHAINFDDVVVKAMEVAWSRAQEECYKDAINEIDKHATWCQVNGACNCGADKE